MSAVPASGQLRGPGTRGLGRGSPANASASKPRQSWTPSSGLAAFVERYDLWEQDLGRTEIYNPLSARNDCFLQFYFGDRYLVVNTTTRATHLSPRCVLIGPHTTRREDLLWTGWLKTFTIRFSPIGFRALFGMPARVIRDYAGDAELVLGRSIVELERRLADASDFELPAVAERFLLSRLTQLSPGSGLGAALRMIRAMRLRPGNAALNAICHSHGLGLRQVERIFQGAVGVTPKMFARLDRLARALRISQTAQSPDWSAVALASGYYDQAHLIREFKAFNGTTPVKFTDLGQEAHALRRTSHQGRGAMSHSSNPRPECCC